MKKVIILVISILFVISCEDTTQTSFVYSDSINDISVDAQGNIWFGTSNFGLVFYNGSKWRNFRTSNSTLPENWIGSIDFDSKGNLWASTLSTFVKYDGKNFDIMDDTLIMKQEGFNKVICLAVDKNDRVWIGTYGTGLYVYEGGQLYKYVYENSNALDDIKYIYVDNNNSVWVVTFFGIFKIDDKIQKMYSETDYLMPDNTIYEILPEKTGMFWAAGSKGISYMTGGGSWTKIDSTSNLLTNYNISSICSDSNNVKWFASFGGGLASYNGLEWKYYNTQNSGIFSNYSLCVAADKNGNIWIGTYGRQVSRFDGKSWKNIDIYDF